MRSFWLALTHFLTATFRRRVALQLEVVALRHQLSVYERSRPRRFRIEPGDRVLWSWLAWLWPAWHQALQFVRPRTVLEWQKRRFRDHWHRKSQGGQPGRASIDPEIRELIRRISRANPTWGSPRIVGELGRLGSYIDFYHRWRVHRSLDMDAPHHRPIQPPELGNVIEFPDVGALQRHYERRAA